MTTKRSRHTAQMWSRQSLSSYRVRSDEYLRHSENAEKGKSWGDFYPFTQIWNDYGPSFHRSLYFLRKNWSHKFETLSPWPTLSRPQQPLIFILWHASCILHLLSSIHHANPNNATIHRSTKVPKLPPVQTTSDRLSIRLAHFYRLPAVLCPTNAPIAPVSVLRQVRASWAALSWRLCVLVVYNVLLLLLCLDLLFQAKHKRATHIV